jgi:hypothetical protein
MTGRQLLRRPGYDIDIEKVLAACAEHGVAVEINANPWRLDLDWRWHETALRLGCMMSINPDAHSTREIDLTHWGVEMARKGGVPKERVLNCLTKEEFATYLKGRRERHHSFERPIIAPKRQLRSGVNGFWWGTHLSHFHRPFRSIPPSYQPLHKSKVLLVPVRCEVQRGGNADQFLLLDISHASS